MKAPRLAAVLVLSFFAAAPAAAQATRTWVSGVGDDANPCSRTAPCKTFAGAISKTAAGGEIDVLDPGGFGAVTITKSISIEAEGVIAGVLVSGTNGIVVQAGVNDSVVLRGLTIDGIGTGISGIRWNSGKNLVIEKCTIKGFTQLGVDVETSGGSGSNLFISDTQIRDNAGGGVLVKPSGLVLKGTLSRVQFNNNDYGVQVEDRGYVTVKNSVASQSATDGFIGHGTTFNAVLYLEDSSAINNTGAGVHMIGTASIAYMSNTIVSGNNPGLNLESGGVIHSWGNNLVGGNFTSDGSPTNTITQK